MRCRRPASRRGRPPPTRRPPPRCTLCQTPVGVATVAGMFIPSARSATPAVFRAPAAAIPVRRAQAAGRPAAPPQRRPARGHPPGIPRRQSGAWAPRQLAQAQRAGAVGAHATLGAKRGAQGVLARHSACTAVGMDIGRWTAIADSVRPMLRTVSGMRRRTLARGANRPGHSIIFASWVVRHLRRPLKFI